MEVGGIKMENEKCKILAISHVMVYNVFLFDKLKNEILRISIKSDCFKIFPNIINEFIDNYQINPFIIIPENKKVEFWINPDLKIQGIKIHRSYNYFFECMHDIEMDIIFKNGNQYLLSENNNLFCISYD